MDDQLLLEESLANKLIKECTAAGTQSEQL